MHVFMNLNAGKPKEGKLSKSMRCIMVFVAVDENGKPVEVPSWEPVNDSDIGMKDYALSIMELRKTNQKNLDKLTEI